MTVEQLNATPLYSKVIYQETNAVILKIKNGEAILWDASSGWQSFGIPADYITLVEAYISPPTTGKPTNISTAPLYSIVTAGGNKGVIVDKRVTLNTFTGVDYWVAMVWFADMETIESFDNTALTFEGAGGEVVTPGPSQKTNWLLYGAIAIGAYLLFIKKKEPQA